MRDDVYESIVYLINHTKGSNISTNRECFKVIKKIYPSISDYTLGSIYSAVYMRRMKRNHFILSKNPEDLLNRFNTAVSEGQSEGVMLRMSDEVDLSPALLARLIVQCRYKDELEESTNASSTKTHDSNLAEEPAIGLSNVQLNIRSMKESINMPTLTDKTPPDISSLLEATQNMSLKETEKHANIPALDLAEEAVSIVDAAQRDIDSLSEKIEEAPFSEMKANEPELDLMKETALIANTSTPTLDLADEVLVINKAQPINDSLMEKIEKAIFAVTKVEIGNEPGLDFTKEAVSLESEIQINDSDTELIKNSSLIETEVKIETTPPNLAEDALIFTEEKSEEPEETDKEALTDEDPLPKITLLALMKDPLLIEDPRLALETSTCMLVDDQYGPVADTHKHLLGQEFEILMIRLAREAKLPFGYERILRTTGFDKTPDIKLNTPVIIDGFIINWIESKALFGDEETHLEYYDEQYLGYYNRFGPGLVIYWFGYQDKITRRYQEQIMIAEDFPAHFEFPDVRVKSFKINRKVVEKHMAL